MFIIPLPGDLRAIGGHRSPSESIGAHRGHRGHRVIGFIAESHLQPEVKELILEKLNINSLVDVATWTDRTREKRKEENP